MNIPIYKPLDRCRIREYGTALNSFEQNAMPKVDICLHVLCLIYHITYDSVVNCRPCSSLSLVHGWCTSSTSPCITPKTQLFTAMKLKCLIWFVIYLLVFHNTDDCFIIHHWYTPMHLFYLDVF